MSLVRSMLITAVLCCLMLPLAASAQDMQPFWTVEEYLERRPEQRQLMQAFAARVSAPAVKLSDRAASGPVRIGLIYPAEQASDYWRRSMLAFTLRLDELGVDYRLDSHLSSPTEPDLQQQLAQLEQALQNNPDYLVYTLSSPIHAAIIERILAAGRTRVILQNITTPLRQWEGMQPFLYVGFDHVTGSRMLAEHMRQHSSGDYVVLKPAPGYLSTVRGDSFVEMMAGSASHRLVDTYHTDLDVQRAYRASLDALQRHPNLRMLYASATDIALGALQALDESGRRGEVMLNGWGGGRQELDLLLSGALDVTVMRINDDNGVAMAEAIAMDITGQRRSVPQIFAGELLLLDKGMSASELEGHRRRAFRYTDPESGS